MRTGICILGFLGASWVSLDALGCACNGVGSTGAPITTEADRWGAEVRLSTAYALGVWDPEGKFRAYGSDELDFRERLAFSLALRVQPNLELSASMPFERASFATATYHDQEIGFGDLSVRARFEFAREPLSDAGFPWPAAALLASIRVPTSSSSPERPASLGLGAFEAALGIELLRSFFRVTELQLRLEFAQRGSDTELGIERQLGPRALAELGYSVALVPTCRIGAQTDLSWEGDTSYDGTEALGSGTRLWTVSAFVAHSLASDRSRATLALEYAPPLDDVSGNAVSGVAVHAALTWAY